MLQIKNIRKQYKTGSLVQKALDGVSLNLRDNEFVAILGPSGSGKTTLLNIIGGLDRYDRGDLIINGITTKEYTDRDWDSYRNHTIGFVFQSYNLIPHQSVLSNVELALTISGISKKERRKRAKQALEQVGLGDQAHKRPNQMSGGQMQRVAIARALVNNPDILLADEPTGALDSETSIQVMELLKDVAKDRLVVMVTHNPELAETYATRIVKLKDGKIINDSDPYSVDVKKLTPPKHVNMGKSSMSLRTALSLSFNNLRTKKARTLLTSFAGSIGIIGIALILSLSNGVNTYITNLQKETMASYPISIEAQSMDLSSMLETGKENTDSQNKKVKHKLNGVYSDNSSLKMASEITTSVSENNLSAFKEYLDDPDSEIQEYIGENGIQYSYDTKFDVYTYDSENVLVNTDGSTLSSSSSMSNPMDSMTGSSDSNNFEELMKGSNGELVSSTVTDNYDLVYGQMPENYNEVLLVLDENNEISTTTLYELGMLPSSEYNELMDKINRGEDTNLKTQKWSYKEVCDKKFYLIPQCDMYYQNENGTFESYSQEEINNKVSEGIPLKVTGVIRAKSDAKDASLSSGIAYTSALTDYLIKYTNDSAIVRAQKASKDINVLNGIRFEPDNESDKIADAKAYIQSLSDEEKANLCREVLSSMASGQSLDGSDAEMAQMLDQYIASCSDDQILSIYNNYISSGTYEDNMSEFGYVDKKAPSAINIYTDSFEDKEGVTDCIEKYNQSAKKANQITYTDYVGLLMSSITTIVDVISYVLIAFVAVSLVVSSIMIGIITYISVLERTKEIGILRAIGASKHNISQVFNAETMIIGLGSGLLGVGITLLLLIPGNAIIHMVTGMNDINASLPIASAIVLILLSVILTLIGGLIPSKKAAKKDPVTALRTE